MMMEQLVVPRILHHFEIFLSCREFHVSMKNVLVRQASDKYGSGDEYAPEIRPAQGWQQYPIGDS